MNAINTGSCAGNRSGASVALAMKRGEGHIEGCVHYCVSAKTYQEPLHRFPAMKVIKGS